MSTLNIVRRFNAQLLPRGKSAMTAVGSVRGFSSREDRKQGVVADVAEKAVGVGHIPPIFSMPRGTPCPYLTFKKVAAGGANMMLAAAPLLELPSKAFLFSHVVPKPLLPEFACPYLQGKKGLQTLAENAPNETQKQ